MTAIYPFVQEALQGFAAVGGVTPAAS